MPRRPLALALLTLAFTALFLPRVAGAQSASAAEGSFAELIAQERMKAGLTSYRQATDLAEVARAHAERMAAEGRLYHNPNLREQVQNWDVVGENVGKGDTVADIHQAFMRSDTHRREILSPRLTEVGVGVVQRNGLIWVSQVFRRPTSAPAATTTAPPRPPAPTSVPATGPRSPLPAARTPAPAAAVPTSTAPAPGPEGQSRLDAAPATGPQEPAVAAAALPEPREVSGEVALATGLLLLVVSGLASQVGGEAAAQRRRPA